MYLKPDYRELKELSILHYVSHYIGLTGADKAAEDRRLFAQHGLLADILKRAGKQTGITARSADGSFLLSKLARYDSGGAAMLGFLAGSHPDHAVEIRLDRKYHAHDILADRTLGLTDTIPAQLKGKQDLPGSIYFVTHVRLYGLLPVKVDALVLEAPAAAPAGDEVKFTVKIPGDLTGTTTVYLTVQSPDGRHLRHYDRSMLVGYGGRPLGGSLKLALNDTPGEWKIAARDMLSGARAEHTLVVRPR